MDKKEQAKDVPKKAPVKAPNVMGGKNIRNKEAMDAAGMKRGGTVKKPGKGRYC
jgi:hypothetical protein